MPLFCSVTETLFKGKCLVDEFTLFSAVGILLVPGTGSSIGVFKVVRSLDKVTFFGKENLGVAVGRVFYSRKVVYNTLLDKVGVVDNLRSYKGAFVCKPCVGNIGVNPVLPFKVVTVGVK